VLLCRRYGVVLSASSALLCRTLPAQPMPCPIPFHSHAAQLQNASKGNPACESPSRIALPSSDDRRRRDASPPPCMTCTREQETLIVGFSFCGVSPRPTANAPPHLSSSSCSAALDSWADISHLDTTHPPSTSKRSEVTQLRTTNPEATSDYHHDLQIPRLDSYTHGKRGRGQVSTSNLSPNS